MRKKLSFFALIGLSLVLLIIIVFNLRTAALSSVRAVHDVQIKEEIMYVSNEEGNQEIYKMDLTSKKISNLSNNPANDMNPQLSPDGRTIVFYSDRDGDNEIYSMDLKSRKIKQLTKNAINDYDPSYSPDGTLIAFKSIRDDRIGDIFVMNIDGSGISNITAANTDTEEWDPVFTPDSAEVIFTIRRNSDDMTDELAKVELATGTLLELTENNYPDWYPSTHPTKDLLLFISRTDPKNRDDLYTSDLSGANRVQLTSLPGNDADPAWNAAGDKIVFINDQDGDYDLYVMDPDGSNIQQIMSSPSNELSPIFLK
jgi:Tol biopolymer transport system component